MSAYDELMQKQAAFMQTPGYMEKQAGAKGKALKEGVEALGKYTGVNPMKALDSLAATFKGAVGGKGAGAARAAAKSVDDIAGSALKGADDVVGAAAKDVADDVAAAAAKKVAPTVPTPAAPPVPPPVPPAEAAVAENIANKPGFWGGLRNRTSELWGKAKNKSSEAWNRAANGTRAYAMAHPLRAAGIAAAGSAGAGALGGAGLAAMMDEDPNQALMRAYIRQRMNPYTMALMQRPMMYQPMSHMAGINPALMGAVAAGGSPMLGLNGAFPTRSDLMDRLLNSIKQTPIGMMNRGLWGMR